ncbi:MAG: hypothetical protein GEV09_20335 [Pseudonocardiaceae bacterium]|nr:hypothetical protein [Pseudonocardiaceae bacterium]
MLDLFGALEDVVELAAGALDLLSPSLEVPLTRVNVLTASRFYSRVPDLWRPDDGMILAGGSASLEGCAGRPVAGGDLRPAVSGVRAADRG